MPTFLDVGKRIELLTILVVVMLKSYMAATHKVSLSIFTDFSGYIFNIVGENITSNSHIDNSDAKVVAG